ncbi:MAG: hypothetical protein AB8G14_02560 [Ilumatobacter sp.]
MNTYQSHMTNRLATDHHDDLIASAQRHRTASTSHDETTSLISLMRSIMQSKAGRRRARSGAVAVGFCSAIAIGVVSFATPQTPETPPTPSATQAEVATPSDSLRFGRHLWAM